MTVKANGIFLLLLVSQMLCSAFGGYYGRWNSDEDENNSRRPTQCENVAIKHNDKFPSEGIKNEETIMEVNQDSVVVMLLRCMSPVETFVRACDHEKAPLNITFKYRPAQIIVKRHPDAVVWGRGTIEVFQACNQ